MTRLRIWSTIDESCVAMTTVVSVRLIRSSSFMMPTLVATHNERLAQKMDRVVRLHEGYLQ